MRIRHKPWAKPELDECPFCVHDANAQRGKWREAFVTEQPIYLELGCGKGGWIAQAAVQNPDVNFIALDIKNEMLALAKRKLEAAYEEAGRAPENVRVAIQNISRISESFSPADKIARIYINFCNPWPKSQHKKRRLTHPRQLAQYKTFLDGELWFKTDDDLLFEESREYFLESGFTLKFETRDLHASGFTENLMTEHEKMFTAEGKKIKFLIAVPVPDKEAADGEAVCAL